MNIDTAYFLLTHIVSFLFLCTTGLGLGYFAILVFRRFSHV